jgi:hypothetical protein
MTKPTVPELESTRSTQTCMSCWSANSPSSFIASSSSSEPSRTRITRSFGFFAAAIAMLARSCSASLPWSNGRPLSVTMPSPKPMTVDQASPRPRSRPFLLVVAGRPSPRSATADWLLQAATCTRPSSLRLRGALAILASANAGIGCPRAHLPCAGRCRSGPASGSPTVKASVIGLASFFSACLRRNAAASFVLPEHRRPACEASLRGASNSPAFASSSTIALLQHLKPRPIALDLRRSRSRPPAAAQMSSADSSTAASGASWGHRRSPSSLRLERLGVAVDIGALGEIRLRGGVERIEVDAGDEAAQRIELLSWPSCA